MAAILIPILGAMAAIPTVRQILLVGAVSNESFGGSRPAVIIFSFDPPVERIATAAAGMVEPVAVAVTPDRRLYIADAGADPLGLNRSRGAIWLVDPAAQVVAPARLVVANQLFRKPADLLLESDGKILLLDGDADPNEWGGANGAIFRIDPTTGNVTVLAAPQSFLEPRSLTVDLDGTLLVVDESANPQGVSDPAGAIFRVNPSTGVVTLERVFRRGDRRTIVAPVAMTVIDRGARQGDYLVVDHNADPHNRGSSPGDVFYVPRAGGDPQDFTPTAVAEFSEPTDVMMGLEDDVYVLDRVATSEQAPLGRGAVFRLRLSDGMLLQSPKVSSAFRNLNTFVQLSGAQLDSSTVTHVDETPGLLRPGDIVTVRARVRNTGTADAPAASLEDTLKVQLQFVPGSDSVGTGQASYDSGTRRFSWSGPIPRGGETTVRFRFKISDFAIPGVRLDHRIVLRTDRTPTSYLRPVTPQREFAVGSNLFLDVSAGVQNSGVIYVARADTTRPEPLSEGGLLVRPSDAVFLEDGRLAVLDPSSPGGQLGAVLVYSFNATDTLSVLLALRRELGFARPWGLALDRDGSLLITDMDANPQGYAYTPRDPFRMGPGPGAVFRFDPATRALSVAAASPDFEEPVDLAVDRRGKLVIVDYLGGEELQGTLWEIDRSTGAQQKIVLDALRFKNPTGITVDAADDLYVTSYRATDGPNPVGGAVYKVRRGTPVTVSVASADTLLRQPADVTVNQTDGSLLVADKDANPEHLPEADRGALFKLNRSTGEVSVVSASGLMRQPDGVVSFGWPELGGSRLSLRTRLSGDPRPGDTLWADVQVINSGLRSSPQTLASLTFGSPSLQVLPAVSPVNGLSIDVLGNRASWTGRVAWGDTMRFSVPSLARASDSYGGLATVSLVVLGGRTVYSSSAWRPVRSEFRPNDLLLVDSGADPNRVGVPIGAVFRLGVEALDPTRLVYTHSSLVGLSAAEWTPTGDLLVAASRGDAPGALYRFDTASGSLVQSGTVDRRIKTPVDLLYGPEGDLLVVDEDAQELGLSLPARGAIFSRRGTGAYELFCADSSFRVPAQAAFGPGGMLYLADSEANPDSASGNTGAVFTIDPSSRKVVGWLQDPAIPQPCGVTVYDDSTLLISDPIGATPTSPRGTLMLYRPGSATRLEPLISWPGLRSLWRALRHPAGKLILLDREGKHLGQTGLGLVREYDPVSRRFSEYAWSDSFAVISDLVMKPGPIVTFPRYDWSDVNGPPIHPADRLSWRAVLHNIGVAEAAGVAYCDSVPAETAVIPESADAVGGGGTPQGVISFDESRALRWSGTIAPGDSVVISYDVQLNPAVAEGRLLTFHPTVSSSGGTTLGRTAKLQTFVPLEQGYAYVVDLGADPFGESGTGQAGALFKVSLTTGATVPMVTSPLFRRPTSVAMVGSSAAPRFLIADIAGRNQLNRIGTLFLFDPATREVRNIGGHIDFRGLVKVLPWTETTALVLDSKADPESLYSGTVVGPGAIFKVDLETAEITPVFSDTTLKAPLSMDWLQPGVLAIADSQADPNGSGTPGTGAIYRLNLASGDLQLFATSTDWRTPGAVCSDLHGGLLLVDRDATPYEAGGGYGSVFEITPQGTVSKISVSRFFVALRDVQAELDGDPLVTDGDADPYKVGGAPGALFRYVTGRHVPIASSRQFVDPGGFVIYGDPTPVDLLEAAADSVAEGIRLRWRAGPDESGVRWLLFRRTAGGPDDPGDATPAGYDPVGGDQEFLGAGPHEYLDRAVTGGQWYAYLVARVGTDGGVDYSAPLLAHAPGTVARLDLRPAAPSPFSGRTGFIFYVPAPGGRVRLEVFDVVGRRARVLHDAPAAPGRHALGWDGRDDSGRRLPSGVYFARLSLGDDTRTRRIVLTR